MPDPYPGSCTFHEPEVGPYAREVAQCWEKALNRLKALLEADAAREASASNSWVRVTERPKDLNHGEKRVEES
jgi:hypothetical protein